MDSKSKTTTPALNISRLLIKLPSCRFGSVAAVAGRLVPQPVYPQLRKFPCVRALTLRANSRLNRTAQSCPEFAILKRTDERQRRRLLGWDRKRAADGPMKRTALNRHRRGQVSPNSYALANGSYPSVPVTEERTDVRKAHSLSQTAADRSRYLLGILHCVRFIPAKILLSAIQYSCWSSRHCERRQSYC